VGAAVVSGGDASPVLEPAEHALDAIALLVEVCVVADWGFSVRPARDAGLDFEIGHGLAKPVAVIALVGDQNIGVRQVWLDGRGASIVADLALGEEQYQWLAVAVADRVQLGVQAAFGPSDTAGNSSFLVGLPPFDEP
jgi:hypothetical protein